MNCFVPKKIRASYPQALIYIYTHVCVCVCVCVYAQSDKTNLNDVSLIDTNMPHSTCWPMIYLHLQSEVKHAPQQCWSMHGQSPYIGFHGLSWWGWLTRSLPQGTGSSEIRTQIAGLRVQSMNHYTTEAGAVYLGETKMESLKIKLLTFNGSSSLSITRGHHWGCLLGCFCKDLTEEENPRWMSAVPFHSLGLNLRLNEKGIKRERDNTYCQ